MSKRSRHADNSKRQQPVQQQRAEAARQALSAAKNTPRKDKNSSDVSPQEKSGR